MATSVPYPRWILVLKSIWSLSAKLCRRNQWMWDINLYSQTPTAGITNTQGSKSAWEPAVACRRGWCPHFPCCCLPKTAWIQVGMGHPQWNPQTSADTLLNQQFREANVVRWGILCHSILLLPLVFFYHLAKRGEHQLWALLQGRAGLRSAFTYLPLGPLLWVGNGRRWREGEKKIKTRNILFKHSWGFPSSQAVMGRNTQWWNYRMREK